MTEKIRTNSQFMRHLFRRSLDKVKANPESPLGEFVNHTVEATKEKMDRSLPGDAKAIDVEGETVEEAKSENAD